MVLARKSENLLFQVNLGLNYAVQIHQLFSAVLYYHSGRVFDAVASIANKALQEVFF